MKLPAVIALMCVVLVGALLWWLPSDTQRPQPAQVAARTRRGPSEAHFVLESDVRKPAPEAPAVAATPSAPASQTAEHTTLEQCLQYDSAETRRACLAAGFAIPPSLDELAAWLCESQLSFTLQIEAVAHFVRQRQPAEAWVWLDGLQTRCTRHRETHFFKGVLQLAGALEPEWLRGFERSLAPEILYAQELGEAPVQIAVMLAQSGSEFARFVLEGGGRGDFGGTARQIDRAASCSLALQQPGEPFYGYLVSVLRSPNLPEDSALGCTLARFLADPRARPNGDALAPMLRLSELLQDRRLRESAALTLLRQIGDEPPKGVDAEIWKGLLAQARAVLPSGLR
jgi:hypothetical protein